MSLLFKRSPYKKRTQGRRAFLIVFACLFLLSAACGLYAGVLQMKGNFHPVVAGLFYRSAQPSEEQLSAYRNTYNIRSVVNLRGENESAAWYRNEVEAAQRLGLRHFDFKMSAGKELTTEQAAALVALFRAAPKPILVHCASGADRSGLASALFVAAIARKGEDAAESQLSFRYGHVGIPFLSSAFAMDSAFEDLEPWLGFLGS